MQKTISVLMLLSVSVLGYLAVTLAGENKTLRGRVEFLEKAQALNRRSKPVENETFEASRLDDGTLLMKINPKSKICKEPEEWTKFVKGIEKRGGLVYGVGDCLVLVTDAVEPFSREFTVTGDVPLGPVGPRDISGPKGPGGNAK